jgi:SAM-dependent methyltransferase
MKRKTLDDYQDYVQVQSKRSGLSHNMNTLPTDLVHFKSRTGQDLLTDRQAYVLDVGCRAACDTLTHLHIQGFVNLFGIDIGHEAEASWPGLPFEAGLKRWDAHEAIPFPFQFDFITISHTLEHCYDPETVARNLYAALKVGGTLHSIVPLDSDETFQRHTPHMVQFETEQDHIQVYEQAGFSLIQSRKLRGNSILFLTK